MRARFVLLLLLFFAASGVQAEDPSPHTMVGAVIPLSGEFGTWGERIKQGLLLGAEDAHHPIDLKFQDEGNCDAKLAVTAALSLVNIEKTKILFMGCLAGTKAAGPLMQRSGVLMLSTGLLDEEVLRQGLPLINLATDFAAEANVLAAHIAGSGMKRVAVLRWPDAFGEEFSRALREALTRHKIETPIDEFSATMNADFRSFLLRLKENAIDAVATNLGDAQTLALMKQLRETKSALKVFSNYVIETNSAPAAELNGIDYTYPINRAEGTEAKKRFDERFRQRFGGDPSANTYFAYDGLVALAQALDSCPATEASCIRQKLLSAPLRGLAGEAKMFPDGRNERPYGIKRVENGRFIWVEKE